MFFTCFSASNNFFFIFSTFFLIVMGLTPVLASKKQNPLDLLKKWETEHKTPVPTARTLRRAADGGASSSTGNSLRKNPPSVGMSPLSGNGKTLRRDAGVNQPKGQSLRRSNTTTGSGKTLRKTGTTLRRTSGPYICKNKFHIPPEQMTWILSNVKPETYKRNPSFMAEGSQGKVYHGYSYKTNKCVAVKVTTLVGEMAEWEKVTLGEIRLLEMLSQHNFEHILQMEYSYHSIPTKEVTVVMELADKTLEDYWMEFLTEHIEKDEQFFLDECKQITLELMAGVNELHNKAHVIHLDLKVKNLMFMPPSFAGQHRGPLKIIDFGGALKLKIRNQNVNKLFQTQNTDEVIGSYEFYSPEQRIDFYYKFIGQNDSTAVSTKSDIWAIGNIVFWMLSGIKRYPPKELVSANEIFFDDSKAFVLDDSESEQTTHDKMREFYFQSEKIKTKLNAPLLYLARSCLHSNPINRPKIEELLNYMMHDYALPVSSQYYKIPADTEPDKTYKMVESGQ